MTNVMRKVLSLFFVLYFLFFAVNAFAATSTINPNVPTQASALSSAVLRGNFLAAYNDINALLAGGAAPPGTNGQIAYNNAGIFGAFTLGGDCTVLPSTGVITCLKTNGVNFSASATTDTTNAANISSGTLPAGRLPNPSASTLGGIQSIISTTHQWIDSISTSGVPHQSQPAFIDISGVANASQIPNPTASTLGGVESYLLVAHQWINTISTSGIPSSSQPACGDLSDSGTACPASTGASGHFLPFLDIANTWSAPQTSSVTTGTAPFIVSSTTRVANLNVASAGNADTVTTNANSTGDVTSVGNATTLATVNSNVGTFNGLTINGKGLVTAATNTSTPTAAIKTIAYTVLYTDDGTYFTNTGATGSVTFTEPVAASGHNSCYIADTAQAVVVAADTGHTIRNGASVTASSGNLTSSGSIGDMVCILALNSTEWYVTKITGTWTVN